MPFSRTGSEMGLSSVNMKATIFIGSSGGRFRFLLIETVSTAVIESLKVKTLGLYEKDVPVPHFSGIDSVNIPLGCLKMLIPAAKAVLSKALSGEAVKTHPATRRSVNRRDTGEDLWVISDVIPFPFCINLNLNFVSHI